MRFFHKHSSTQKKSLWTFSSLKLNLLVVTVTDMKSIGTLSNADEIKSSSFWKVLPFHTTNLL